MTPFGLSKVPYHENLRIQPKKNPGSRMTTTGIVLNQLMRATDYAKYHR